MKSPSRLSYSAVSSYGECGEKYRLSRGHKLDKSTWFATVAGSAVHTITENWDLREMGLEYNEKYVEPEHFGDLFRLLLATEAEHEVTVKPSGKVLKNMSLTGGPNKKDQAWWEHYGPTFVQNYIKWRQSSNWIIAIMPDGSPGIEVKVEAKMGDEPFLGFIDRVFITDGGEGDFIVVDIKSGNEPSGVLQLGTYKVALENAYGITPEWGTYWMAPKGEITPVVDLSRYDTAYVQHLYTMARAGIEAGVFLPNVTSMCKACPVREYCRAVDGKRAGLLPVVEEIVHEEVVAQATS